MKQVQKTMASVICLTLETCGQFYYKCKLLPYLTHCWENSKHLTIAPTPRHPGTSGLPEQDIKVYYIQFPSRGRGEFANVNHDPLRKVVDT